MIMRTLAAAFVVLTAIGIPGHAQTHSVDLETLDTRLEEIVARENVVGASIAIANDEGVFFATGYGYWDQEAGIQATADTPFRAGSVSKLVTALTALRLVEAGQLDIDTPLREAAPDIAFTNQFEQDFPVRLVHLLEHTTGWDDIHPKEYRSFPEGTTLSEGLDDNPLSRTSRWAPGHYASYSNAGPAVMGQVIETQTGLAFETMAQRLVFEPLSLDTASFDQDRSDRQIKSYNTAGEVTPFSRIWPAPSGALSIGARDLAELGRVMMIGGSDLISPSTHARMERAETSHASQAGAPAFALGLYQDRDATGAWMGHAGAIDTSRSEVFYNRDTGLAYALLVNTGGQGIWDLHRAIREALGTHEAVPEAEQNWQLPDGAGGVYRIINPRQEMNRIFYDLSDLERVWQCGEELCVTTGYFGSPRRYTSMGEGQFYKTNEPHKRIRLIEMNAGEFELAYADGESWKQSSHLRMGAPTVIGGATLMLVLSGVVSLLIWLVTRPFGLFKNSHRWRVWTWPSLAVASLGLSVFAISALSSGDVIANLSGPSLIGRLFQLGTLACGPIALVGVWAAFRAQNVSAVARYHAGLTSGFLSLFWAWMAVYGWVGLPLWSYTPKVFG